MQLSLEKLRSLSEADLRRKVLIPLFRAMGFRDVVELHGSGELGKDIVMWKEDAFHGRVNYAVVAKAQRLATGTQSFTVCRQIREAFGSSYTDPVALVERDVDHVIVVTSREVTNEARDSIRSELKSSKLEGMTDLIDGEKLFLLVRQHLPEAVLWDPLRKAGRVLQDASDNWNFTLQVGPDGVSSVFVSAKHEESQLREPIKGEMSFRFPATPEGISKRLEYQRFLEKGTPVELTAENIETFEIPEFLRSLAPEGEITRLFLAPSALEETMIRTLAVLDVEGRPLFSLEYIHFTHRQGGSREFSLDNRGQPIPFRVRLIFDKETEGLSFSLSFEPNGSNVMHYMRWLSLQKAASVGHRMVLIDWNTGLIEMGCDVGSLGMADPSDEVFRLARQLVFVQHRTGVEISLNDEDQFSMQDVSNANLASHIVSSGRSALDTARLDFSVIDPTEFEAKVSSKIEFPIIEPDFVLEILGSRISLGEAHVLARGILKKLEAPGEDRNSFYIEASPDEPFLAMFPKWLPRSEGDAEGTPDAEDQIEGNPLVAEATKDLKS